MKTSNLKTILALFLIVTALGYGQNETNIEKEAVINVMKTYKDALQNLSTEGTFDLFTEESEVFESGGVEGTYAHYIEHHLGPELGHFEKFEFSDYEIDAKLDVPYAFTTETYVYTIVIKPDDKGNSRTIKKKVWQPQSLKKIDSQWKITKMHSSSRNVK